nr:MAG TPA: hypothetical protein [Caudoviricetes sp.]
MRGANSIWFMLNVSPLMSPLVTHFVFPCHSNRHPSCHPKAIFAPKSPVLRLHKTKKRLPTVQIRVGNRSTIVQSAF